MSAANVEGGNLLMKRVSMLCLLFVSLAVLSLIGCKIRIIVPEGGDVRSESGAYGCDEEDTCDMEVVDFFFNETFVAEPSDGYKFKFWKKGPGRLCGWTKEPCPVYTSGFEGRPDLYEMILSFLESDEIFYLEPVFVERNTCTDRVSGSNNEFTLRQGESTVREVRLARDRDGRSFKTRTEGCPEGVCSARSVGYDSKSDFREITFSTTPDTPIGTYNIQYINYKGGRECGAFLFLFTCTDNPIKIRKIWRFKLNIAECPA
jgi:hypothetical protein